MDYNHPYSEEIVSNIRVNVVYLVIWPTAMFVIACDILIIGKSKQSSTTDWYVHVHVGNYLQQNILTIPVTVDSTEETVKNNKMQLLLF